MTVVGIDDLIEAGQSLVKANDIVEDFLVDFVCVFEFPEVDALDGSDDLDLGSI